MPRRTVVDDEGTEMVLASCRRVVSLVPSLTETIGYEAPEILAGRTDWCTHPPGLTATRVGGTKWPDLDAVTALRPDLVIANAEENRPEDIAALRERGLVVYVTAPSSIDTALESLSRMLVALRLSVSGWIDTARKVWQRPDPQLAGKRVACFIWRRPWMVLGRDTFAGDVLHRLGLVNVYAEHAERYPKLGSDAPSALDVDLVVLPDEPYAFSPTDGPEAFPRRRVALISGRHLTWYGPSLLEARTVLPAALRTPVMRV